MMTIVYSCYLGGEDIFYFNNEQLQIDEIKIMNAEYGSSLPLLSIDSSKFTGHNTYNSTRRNFHQKPTHTCTIS